MRKIQTFKPGDPVKLTSKFLRNTGQYVGGEGHSRWIVVECDCKGCVRERTKPSEFPLVAVNEPREPDPLDPPDDQVKWRHIAAGNLMLADKPDYS